jgi:hypothetical protein
VKIIDIDHGQVAVAATGEFGHTYLLRSINESDPHLISRFNWPGAIDSEDPKFNGYIQDLRKASGR